MGFVSENKEKVRVLCVGAATMDTIFSVSELPMKPGKVIPLDAVEIAAGMASSAAVAISKLGGHAVLWSSVGDDGTGDRIVRDLTAEGVDCAFVKRASGARSAFSTILVDMNGERIVVPHYDPRLFADADWLPLTHVPGFDCVLADVRWPSGAAAALSAARAAHVPAVLDADVAAPSTLAQLVPLASHVVFSEPAALDFTGASGIPHALEVLSERRSGFMAVTAGAEGCFWFDRKKRTVRQIVAPSVTVIDTLSAGDAFHGAFALGLAEGGSIESAESIENIVRFANTVAALKCTRFGGRRGLPTRGEVERYLEALEPAR